MSAREWFVRDEFHITVSLRKAKEAITVVAEFQENTAYTFIDGEEMLDLLRAEGFSVIDKGEFVGGDVLKIWEAVIVSAPAWAALASVLKTFLTRRNGRKVVVYNKEGNKVLEVTGDLTVKDIEALLFAQRAQLPSPDETTEDERAEGGK